MTSPVKVIALVVAAGRGERAGAALPKQYAPLGGRAMLWHALASLQAIRAIDEIRVVIGEGQQEFYEQTVGGLRLAAPIVGGSERRISVFNGLRAIAAEGGCDVVLVHDAARPFVPEQVVARLLAALRDAAGAVPCLPVADTLVRSGDGLGETVPREGLLRVQTPQAFAFDAVLEAHRRWPADQEATDDAQMVRAAGFRVVAVEGDRMLEKITYPADVLAAEQRMQAGLVTRTASGFDVHRFADGDGVRIGGIDIPHSRALAGHSDADVALHALTDALLGTIGDGDIGTHFPPSDAQWRGADSARFLEHARELVRARGGRIDHVDLTIICEAPKIGPHRAAIRARIAALLRLPESRISIKATTTERLGFTGREEGIAAQALATVRLPEDL